MSRTFAIDPGNTQSALCVIDTKTLKPGPFLKADNDNIRQYIAGLSPKPEDTVAIEMLQSYGNLIGRDVLETAVWVGRFYEQFLSYGITPILITRMEEKMHICHDSKAGDANIRRALIDRFCTHDFKNGKGTNKNPDFFYGFKADVWQAYAVGLTFIETRLCDTEISHNVSLSS